MLRLLVLCLTLTLPGAGFGMAQGHPAAGAGLDLPVTGLVDISVGSPQVAFLGAMVRDYDLADGTPANLRAMYRSRWRDAAFLMMTELGENTGLLWGASLGDRGRKYRIDPSLRLGLVHAAPIGRHGTLSLKLLYRIGGRLTERPCTADYGDIGGVQAVNCRLAAEPIPPAQTLAHLFDLPPPDRVELSVGLSWAF